MSTANQSAGFARLGIILLLCPVILPVLALLASAVIPRGYTSTATVEVPPDSPDPSLLLSDRDKARGNPDYVPSQIQRIRSDDVLSPVALQFDLADKLPRMLRVSRVRDTHMVDIAVNSPMPKQAADIANAIAAQYQKISAGDLTKWINSKVSSLAAEVEKDRKRVQAATEELTPILTSETTGVMNGTDGAQNMPLDDSALEEMKQNLDDMKASLEKIGNTTAADMKDIASEFDPQDSIVTKTIPAYADALADEAELVKAGTGDDDTSLKNVRDRKADLENEFSEARTARMEGMRTRIAIAQDLLDATQKRLDETKQAIQDFQPKSGASGTAKNKFLDARHTLDAAQADLENAKLQLKINHPGAGIWQIAQPAQLPSTPDLKSLLLAAFCAGLLCALPGGILLFMGAKPAKA